MEEKIASIQELSQILKLTPQRIQQLTFEGLPKVAHGKYPVLASVWWYIDYLRALANVDTKEGVQQKERLIRLKAEKEEIELQKLQGTVLDAEETTQALMEILTILKSEILGLPGRLSQELQNHTASEIKEILDIELRLILNNVSQKLKINEQSQANSI